MVPPICRSLNTIYHYSFGEGSGICYTGCHALRFINTLLFAILDQ